MTDDYKAMSGRDRRRLLDASLARHGRVCCICLLPIAVGDESLQHVVPRSRGGTTDLDNCRPAHKSCNYQLGNRDVQPGITHDGLAFFCPD